jgi:hypothetical protein
MAFRRLIRFVDTTGATLYGDLPGEYPREGVEGARVDVLHGDLFEGLSKSDKQATVKKVRLDFIYTIFVITGI